MELRPLHQLRNDDVIYNALDTARIALFKCQRGDSDVSFDAVDALLSRAMDQRWAEKSNSA